MNRRHVIAGLFSSLSFTSVLAGQSRPEQLMPALPRQRILIHVHIDDPASWKSVLAKADAYVSSGKPGSTYVEILSDGDGLRLVDKDGPMRAEVMDALQKDVTFVVCHASMLRRHMAIDQLHAGVGTVPGGKREIALRERDGWTIVDQAAIQ